MVLTPPADQGMRAGKIYNQRETLMDLLIVVIVLLFLFGGHMKGASSAARRQARKGELRRAMVGLRGRAGPALRLG